MKILRVAYILGTACFGAPLYLSAAPTVQPANPAVVPLRIRTILNAITPGELKGDLSFLASDALQGRYTPSPGLEVAAEFIASQFRAAGLEPAGDEDYFQVAHMIDRKMPNREAQLKLSDGSKDIALATDAWQVRDASAAAHLENTPIIFFPTSDVEALRKAQVAGKVVMVQSPDFRKLPPEAARAEHSKLMSFNQAVAASKAAAEIVIVDAGLPYSGSRLLSAEQAKRQFPPILLIKSSAVKATQIKSVTVDFPAPEDHPSAVKNVIGILRGSDPKLKDTYVLLTAHYDHIGTRETAAGMSSPPRKDQTEDHIYNGANDDGSGTVSVIEIARALAKLNPHPKRSIVFMTFFGEERGELGSKYYAVHPAFPISKTAADINLEQVGRTDSTNGKQVNTASVTGYDYSDVTKYLERAGQQTGIKVYKDKEASDAYFTRSDNGAFAEQGVPAHTLSVAFDYPDYHGLGDEWQKIDYDNMARVDRMIALGLIEMANDPKAPAWDALNPKTAPFREARQNSLGH